jgi:hypothetical protein
MKETKIILIEDDIETAKTQISKITASFKGQDIVIIGGVGEGRTVLFPDNITLEDVVTIDTKDIPLSELVKTLNELAAQKGLVDLMRGMESMVIEPLPQMNIPFISDDRGKSSFIPQRGGDNSSWKKGRRK